MEILEFLPHAAPPGEPTGTPSTGPPSSVRPPTPSYPDALAERLRRENPSPPPSSGTHGPSEDPGLDPAEGAHRPVLAVPASPPVVPERVALSAPDDLPPHNVSDLLAAAQVTRGAADVPAGAADQTATPVPVAPLAATNAVLESTPPSTGGGEPGAAPQAASIPRPAGTTPDSESEITPASPVENASVPGRSAAPVATEIPAETLQVPAPRQPAMSLPQPAGVEVRPDQEQPDNSPGSAVGDGRPASTASADSRFGASPVPGPTGAAPTPQAAAPADWLRPDALAAASPAGGATASGPMVEVAAAAAATTREAGDVETGDASRLPQADADEGSSRGQALPGRSARIESSSAGTRTAPLAPANPVEFADRLARALLVSQESGRPLHVRLHPSELGVMQIELSRLDGTFTARLDVESSAARQAVLEQLPQLRDALAQAGHSVERIEVHLLERRGDGPPGHGGQREHLDHLPQDDTRGRRGRAREHRSGREGLAPVQRPLFRPPGFAVLEQLDVLI
ncbi:MAG TPA: flagellar hook-length control protein FliK [Planctomycetaceae bacterium]|nr:flagellar hook-length control protein FliK [Planctomycetaceae bacterium]